MLSTILNLTTAVFCINMLISSAIYAAAVSYNWYLKDWIMNTLTAINYISVVVALAVILVQKMGG